MANSIIYDTVSSIILESPGLDNYAIAERVNKLIKGASTTANSVGSMRSRLKKDQKMGVQPRSDEPQIFLSTYEDIPEETTEEAFTRILTRYEAMGRMAEKVVKGKIPSLIISGPPGLGKSFTVKKALAEEFPEGPENLHSSDEDLLHYDIISGSISAVGLYKALYQVREGGVLVLDDVDDVFRDETALNLLKAALDSSPVRIISWRKEAQWLRDNNIPDRFEFRGHVIFLTNIDFELLINSGKKDTEHFKALIDRSMYLCLTLRTKRDFMIRITQVASGEEGMLHRDYGFGQAEIEEVLQFVEENKEKFYNLSLRLIGQIALCKIADPENWKRDIVATKMKTTK